MAVHDFVGGDRFSVSPGPMRGYNWRVYVGGDGFPCPRASWVERAGLLRPPGLMWAHDTKACFVAGDMFAVSPGFMRGYE